MSVAPVRPPPPLPAAPAPSAALAGGCSDLDRLHDDCRRGHTSGVREFIGEQPALVNQQDSMGFTALHWAAQTGHVDIVELLLHSGASVNCVNHNGDTPLHCAVWKQHALVVGVLLADQWKARTDIKNHDGKTAEELARTDAIRDALAKPSASLITMVAEPDDDSDDE